MSASRLAGALAAVVVAFLLQVTVLPQFAWRGTSADLVLLVVVAAALATDTRFATLLGFGAGLLVDLSPPADHVAGRWALALMVVGYVVGRLSHDHHSAAPGLPGLLGGELDAGRRRPALPVLVAIAAGGSFVGTSVFALSGLVLADPLVGFGDVLGSVLASVVWDAAASVVVVPLAMLLLARGDRTSRRSTFAARAARETGTPRPTQRTVI